jgi:hypothetical protein
MISTTNNMFNFDQFGNWVSSESSVTPQDSLHVSHGKTKRLGSMSRSNHSRDWWRALSYGPVTWPLSIQLIFETGSCPMNIPLWPIYSCPFIQISNRCPNQFPPPSLLYHHYPWGPTVAMITFFLPRTLNQIRLRSTLHVYYMWHAYYTYMHEWYPWCVFIHARMDVPLSPLCMLYAHDIWQNNLMNSLVHNMLICL